MRLILRRNLAVLIILGAAALLAMLLAKTRAARTLEIASLEYRFVYRGPQSADSNLVFVLWDGLSKSKLKRDKELRSSITTLIRGLAKMQARVVTVDFLFEERKESRSDSILCEVIENTPQAVTGFYHYEAVNEPQAVPLTQNAYDIDTYKNFFIASDTVTLMAKLHYSKARRGHTVFLKDTVTYEIRSVPLYIKSDVPRAALSIETVKTYLGITDKQIKVTGNKLALFPAGREPIRIPINTFGEYDINYLGAEDVFANRHSFYDIYNLCQAALADTSPVLINRDFTDKIVFIGSILDDDQFVTPFAHSLPGVFIHATTVDNILREQFLIHLPQGTEWGILGVMGILLFWLFSKGKLGTQALGVAVILTGYTVLTFIVFDHTRIVAPLFSVATFVLLALTFQGVNLYVVTLNRQQANKERIRRLAHDIDRIADVRALKLSRQHYMPSPHYFFAIDAREERDEYTFISWLKFIKSAAIGIGPFEPEIKVSLPVHSTDVNKLEHDIQRLWQRYSQGLETAAARNNSLSLDEEFKKIGGRVFNEFGLKPTFNELFNHHIPHLPLKLAVNNLKIPWHWAFHEPSRSMLCEKYPLAFTFFDSAKEPPPQLEPHEPKPVPNTAAGRMAVLFYGDWQGHPKKHLHHVRDQIVDLQKQLTWKDCSTLVVRDRCQDFLNRLTKACAEGSNLRLIHYAGHAEKGFLDVGENDYLKSNTISGNLGLSFPSRPLVFLNACSSGRLTEKWDRMDNLCTEFLACGAGACIVTTFDVYEKTANRFAQTFYEHFVTKNLTAGEALQSSITDLGKPDKLNGYDPDYDITRYFYTLYGDPTIKF